MPKYTLANPHKAVRYLGDVYVQPGETLDSVELTERDAELFATILEVSGGDVEAPRRGRPPNKIEGE